MSKIALLTLHGMGDTPQGYSADLWTALRDTLRADLEHVERYEVYYQDLLQANEAAIWDASKEHLHYDALRRFILFGLADAAGLYNGKEQPDSVYEGAQRRIADQLLAARDAQGPGVKIVAIAQSLGCQVLSTYLWDAQRAVAAATARTGDPAAPAAFPTAGVFRQEIVDEEGWDLTDLAYLAGANLWALHTTGCNIPIFVAAHRSMQIKAIARPRVEFTWTNYFDPDDVLGWPLQPLGGGYETLVEDRRINSGQGFINFIKASWNPLSHTTYWTDDDVVGPLARCLRRLSS